MIFLTLYTAIEAASGGRGQTYAQQMAQLEREIEEEKRLADAVKAGDADALRLAVERSRGGAYEPYGRGAMGQYARPPEAPLGYRQTPALPGASSPYQRLPEGSTSLTIGETERTLTPGERLTTTTSLLASDRELLALKITYDALRSQELLLDHNIRKKFQELPAIIEALFDMKQESPDDVRIDALHKNFSQSRNDLYTLQRRIEDEKPPLVRAFLPFISGEGRSLAKSEITEFEGAFALYDNRLKQIQTDCAFVFEKIELLMRDPSLRRLSATLRQERYSTAGPREIGKGLEGGAFEEEVEVATSRSEPTAAEALSLAESAAQLQQEKVTRLADKIRVIPYIGSGVDSRLQTLEQAEAKLARAKAKLARVQQALAAPGR